MQRVPFLCLANSRKHGGRCLAGLRLDTGEWLRPVSDTESGALAPEHTCYPDGAQPRVLDRLELGLERPAPKPHQPENWTIAPGSHRYVGMGLDETAAQMLGGLCLKGPEVFGNRADRVPLAALGGNGKASSLALIRPEGFRLHVTEKEVQGRAKRLLRGTFRLGGVEHRLAVTDLAWERALERQPLGEYEPSDLGVLPDQELLLTLSLSEPFGEPGQENCFKLIAAVIPVYKGLVAGAEPTESGPCALTGKQSDGEKAAVDGEQKPDSDLLKRLRQWRLLVAKKLDVPAFHILHDSHLENLARIRPRDEKELRRVPGFGPKRIDDYGTAIFQILHGDIPEGRASTEPATLGGKLRALCKRLAEPQGVPWFYIMNSATIEDLVARHPRDEQELLEVLGIGPVKTAHYGAAILELLARHGGPEPTKPPADLQEIIRQNLTMQRELTRLKAEVRKLNKRLSTLGA